MFRIFPSSALHSWLGPPKPICLGRREAREVGENRRIPRGWGWAERVHTWCITIYTFIPFIPERSAVSVVCPYGGAMGIMRRAPTLRLREAGISPSLGPKWSRKYEWKGGRCWHGGEGGKKGFPPFPPLVWLIQHLTHNKSESPYNSLALHYSFIADQGMGNDLLPFLSFQLHISPRPLLTLPPLDYMLLGRNIEHSGQKLVEGPGMELRYRDVK
jgi:hypothetical protein